MIVKFGPPAPQSTAEHLARFHRQDGANSLAMLAAVLQPSISSAQASSTWVSDSISAAFSTQPDPHSCQGSPPVLENGHYSNPPQKEPTLAYIMLTIQDYKASLTTQIETIHIDFSLLKQDVLYKICGSKQGQLKNIISLEHTLHPLSATMLIATDKLLLLRAKIDDLENCSHRNNLPCMGFPELSE